MFYLFYLHSPVGSANITITVCVQYWPCGLYYHDVQYWFWYFKVASSYTIFIISRICVAALICQKWRNTREDLVGDYIRAWGRWKKGEIAVGDEIYCHGLLAGGGIGFLTWNTPLAMYIWRKRTACCSKTRNKHQHTDVGSNFVN